MCGEGAREWRGNGRSSSHYQACTLCLLEGQGSEMSISKELLNRPRTWSLGWEPGRAAGYSPGALAPYLQDPETSTSTLPLLPPFPFQPPFPTPSRHMVITADTPFAILAGHRSPGVSVFKSEKWSHNHMDFTG